MSDTTTTKSYADFITRPQANEGIKIDLMLPTGEKSEHWLLVAGVDSDIYRKGKAGLMRLALKQGKEKSEDESKENEEYNEAIQRLYASCILDWSFSEGASIDEKVSLLADAPQLRDRLEDVIYSRSLFAKKK